MQYSSLQVSRNRSENFRENALDIVNSDPGKIGTVGVRQALRIPSGSNSYDCDLLG